MLFISTILLRNAIILGILLSSNPITLRVWILFTALSITFSLGLLTISWYRLILFIIYIGGILVIFSYFTAIQPNQQLSFKKIFLITLITTSILIIFTPNILKPLVHIIKQEPLLPHLYIFHYSSPFFIFIVSILLLALVAVVKISKFPIGPLRPFFYVSTSSKNSPSNKNYQ